MRKGIYKHYKDKLYEVLWEVRHSETDEELVLYKSLYKLDNFPEETMWVRPKGMFLETIEFNGKMQKRFEYIGDKKHEST